MHESVPGLCLFGERCHHRRTVFTNIPSDVINLGSMIKDKNRAFCIKHSLWFWWINKHGYTQKVQIPNVKYSAGSVMITDCMNYQQILNDCFWHEATTGLWMDHMIQNIHPKPHKMVQWPQNEAYERWKHVRWAEDESPQERTLEDLLSDSLLCRGSLRSNVCKKRIQCNSAKSGWHKAKSGLSN